MEIATGIDQPEGRRLTNHRCYPPFARGERECLWPHTWACQPKWLRKVDEWRNGSACYARTVTIVRKRPDCEQRVPTSLRAQLVSETRNGVKLKSPSLITAHAFPPRLTTGCSCYVHIALQHCFAGGFHSARLGGASQSCRWLRLQPPCVRGVAEEIISRALKQPARHFKHVFQLRPPT